MESARRRHCAKGANTIERALIDSDEWFRRLLDSIGQAIIGLDHGGRCTFSNPACLRLLRYSDPGDLLGKNIHSVCHPTRPGGDPNRPEECRACQAFRKGEEIHVEDQFLRRADGTSFPAEYWSYPMLGDGEAAGAVVTFLDRTLRKTVRATAEFLRNISHGLRTSMNGIMGMAQLALDTELTAEQRDYLESVKTSADVLLTTINNILEFSGIETGELSLQAIEFDLHDMLGKTAKLLGPAAHRKGLELLLDIRPAAPRFVRGDPVQLGQIIAHLTGNAIKFTEHGEIVLQVDTESQDAEVVVSHFMVTDTGIGIPPQTQRVIFEPFSNAYSSMTRGFRGAGLGLAVSARLVGMMGGRIWVESEPGLGSRFHFTARFERAQGKG